ncbi:hypothetical protein [Paenibacillus sp. RC67]|uniref:hypothetical protein n=1 Tax=Paenibacillus sp. RC67 TaxID=3039392 RepID=UPI0024AE220B|nr:hypothetical protein [Paenibacillus sp. RC67]
MNIEQRLYQAAIELIERKSHKFNTPITHSLCVIRNNETAEYSILTPCGICQERLFYWGAKVKAAVSTSDGSLCFKTLEEIQPYHWYQAIKDGKENQ